MAFMFYYLSIDGISELKYNQLTLKLRCTSISKSYLANVEATLRKNWLNKNITVKTNMAANTEGKKAPLQVRFTIK